MAEIKLFYHKDGVIRLSRSLDFLKSTPIENFLWIDLIDVDEEIENELEDFLKIYIQEEEEIVEIEMSSRYIETNDTLVVNSNFLLSNFESDPVSFILKNNILVTVHSQELISFHETIKKISANPKNYTTGADVLVALFETRVEFDADMIEDMTQKITLLSNNISLQEADEELLSEIKIFRKNHDVARKHHRQAANGFEHASQRIHACRTSTQTEYDYQDINSLIEHINFSFDRLTTCKILLGYVNVEQNKIIKIFTIVSVVFMPPHSLPPLRHEFSSCPNSTKNGDTFSIIIMVLSAVFILLSSKENGCEPIHSSKIHLGFLSGNNVRKVRLSAQ